MSVTNLPISGWNVDCLPKILHGIGRVIGHDKISLKFTSLYALRILFGTMSWEVLHTTVTLRLNGEDYCGNRLTSLSRL
jgi:hypothetical protein